MYTYIYIYILRLILLPQLTLHILHPKRTPFYLSTPVSHLTITLHANTHHCLSSIIPLSINPDLFGVRSSVP